MKQWLPAAVCALGLGSTTAMAGADTVGLGDGHNGELRVSAPNTIINSYAQVIAPLVAQATSIQIGACKGDPACFVAGDLVMVYQATGLQPVPASGSQTPIDLSNNAVGQWEFARVASVEADRLTLTEPLIHAYAVNDTQIIRVPEYTQVTITGSIIAPAWDGATGGFIAFLARETVNNGGVIDASGRGFRGGQFIPGDSTAKGCSDLDEAAPLGARKGEGIVGASRYSTGSNTGRGNAANGAGGAVCSRSGGGGGGNGGTGGQGGRSESSDSVDNNGRDVGGRGGVALSYGDRATSDAFLRRLTFGGGGGAGYGGTLAGSGGAGGGIVFFRARQLSGGGFIDASGRAGGANTTEGGGGGGAGGSIYVRIVRAAACGTSNSEGITATGGLGGASDAFRVGPGGGGGGGHVLFQADPGGTCNLKLTGSSPGNQKDAAALYYGATEGNPKPGDPIPDNKLNYGFIIPNPPSITTPTNGSFINNVRPTIKGTALANIPVNSPASLSVIIYLDGQEIGRATADKDGNYTFDLPRDLSEGPHTVIAVGASDAVQSLNSVPDTFTVDITPPDTNFVTQPGRFTRARDVNFEFGSPEESVTYLCKLDDAADFTPCPASKTFTGLSDGPHKVEVYAVDRAGNRDDTPAVHEFQITVADLSLLGDGIGGCSASGQDASLIALGLGALVAGLRRRRQSQTH
ncbi:adventurous gliding motility protein AgmC [Cystobacter fuscus]|uniref:adventurous gliding motility protein AgmC n=1 Tax=Cystobacter fuscus TaxID=43 RepID=UPI0037BEF76F